MSDTSTNYVVRDKNVVDAFELKDILDTILFKIPNPQVPYIHGAPGIGKSQMIAQIAKERGIELIDIRLANCADSGDIRGLPTFNVDKNDDTKKRTIWSLPEMFPTDPNWKGIIFFDEFNLAQPSVMSACYQLILDRQIGNYKLPDGAVMVAAGNPRDCNINAEDLPQALKNRFKHYYLQEDIKPWIVWATKNNVNTDLITFLSTVGSEFFMDIKRMNSQANEFGTPRTWAAVSDILNLTDISLDLKMQIINGYVGNAATIKLREFLVDKTRYQDPREIYEEGKKFTATSINEFYGCFVSLCSSLIRESRSRQEGITAMTNTLKALVVLPTSEWKAFAAKMIANIPELDSLIEGPVASEMMITLANGK